MTGQTLIRFSRRLSLALALAVALPAAASAEGLTEGEAMSAVERWRADPGTPIPASEVDLDEFRWIARPLVVFAESEADPRFGEQMDLLMSRVGDLIVRDVVIITDTDPDARSQPRTQLRPRGFMLVVMDKGGRVELRKPTPWAVREISRTIDKMPLRQQEIRERGAAPVTQIP